MMKKVLKAMLEHSEAFDGLNDLLEERELGPQRCHNLAKSMNERLVNFMREQADLYEAVGPPMADIDDDENPEPPEGDEEDAMGELDDEGMPDDMGGNEEAPDEESPDEEAPDEEAPDEGDEEGAPEDGEEDPFGGEEGEPEGDESGDSPAPKRLKKKFAHNNMLDAMSKFDSIKAAMKAY
jgi:hypothetical protein